MQCHINKSNHENRKEVEKEAMRAIKTQLSCAHLMQVLKKELKL